MKLYEVITHELTHTGERPGQGTHDGDFFDRQRTYMEKLLPSAAVAGGGARGA